MKKLMKDINKKFVVMILFSWLFFIGAIYLGITNIIYLPIEQNVIDVFVRGYFTTGQQYFHLLFVLGLFGPLFIYIWHYKEKVCNKKVKLLEMKKNKDYYCKKEFVSLVKFEKVNKYFVLLVVLLPLLSFGLIFIFDKLLNFDQFFAIYQTIYFIPLFLFTFITYATSEFGFRKYFLDNLLKKKSFFESSLMVAVMSLIWVLPYIGYFHFIYGYESIILSLIFYSVFYISMSIILSFLYYDTKNILFNWIASAWFYSVYLFALSKFYDSYIGLIIFSITFLTTAALFIKYDYKKS